MNQRNLIDVETLDSPSTLIAFVLRLSKSSAQPDVDSDAHIRNRVEGICIQMRTKLESQVACHGALVAFRGGDKLRFELTPFASNAIPDQFETHMSKEDFKLLDTSHLGAIKVDDSEDESQLGHPDRLIQELTKIEDSIVRFHDDAQASQVLDGLAQAVAWAEDKGLGWAGVAVRKSGFKKDAVLEVRPLCSHSPEDLTLQCNSLGTEWIEIAFEVRINDCAPPRTV